MLHFWRLFLFTLTALGLFALSVVVCFAFGWQPWTIIGLRQWSDVDRGNFIAEALALFVEGSLFAVVLGYFVPIRMQILQDRRDNQAYSGLRVRYLKTIVNCYYGSVGLLHSVLIIPASREHIQAHTAEYSGIEVDRLERLAPIYEALRAANVKGPIILAGQNGVLETPLSIADVQYSDDTAALQRQAVLKSLSCEDLDERILEENQAEAFSNSESYGFALNPQMGKLLNFVGGNIDLLQKNLDMLFNRIRFVGADKQWNKGARPLINLDQYVIYDLDEIFKPPITNVELKANWNLGHYLAYTLNDNFDHAIADSRKFLEPHHFSILRVHLDITKRKLARLERQAQRYMKEGQSFQSVINEASYFLVVEKNRRDGLN